jgi:hypothetical protein
MSSQENRSVLRISPLAPKEAPPDPSSIGELFSSYFIDSVSLIDNFMPAQFGYRNEGVVDIHTKDGCLEPGGRLEYYGGQRGTILNSVITFQRQAPIGTAEADPV